jgi:hypothetical protein
MPGFRRDIGQVLNGMADEDLAAGKESSRSDLTSI